MKQILMAAAGLMLAACSTPRPGGVDVPSSNDYLLPPKVNTAPRNSPEFCRTYGQQSASDRVRASSNTGGRGPSGFDFFLAQRAGQAAADRCRAGRT